MNINPFDILKNAGKIQEQMGVFQERLGLLTATGSSGGGMAEVIMNGKMEVLSLQISPEAMEDREMLQDLVMAAFNNALEKVRELIQKETMAMIPGGIQGFPGSPA